MRLFIALCITALAASVTAFFNGYLNGYGGEAAFECDDGYGLTDFYSSRVQDPTGINPDDRQWEFDCLTKVNPSVTSF